MAKGVIKCLNLFILFMVLLSLFPFTVSATPTGKGEVRLIKVDGTVTTEGIERSENFSKPSNNEETVSNNKTDSTPAPPTDTQIEAGTLMLLNANKAYAQWIPDTLYNGGLELSSMKVDEENVTGSNTPSYKISSTEIKPFDPPFVKTFLLITGSLHLGICIIFACLGSIMYNASQVDPKRMSKIRAGFSGEESYFDVISYMILICAVFFSPFLDSGGIWSATLLRNIVVSFMTTRMVDIIGLTTMSLPTELLVNLSWYCTKFSELCGEYAVYLMGSLVVLKAWVMGVVLLYGTLKQAAMLQATVVIGFVMVLSMDVITVTLVSFGVQLGVYKESPFCMLAGMTFAAIADIVILLFLVGIPSVLLYSRIVSGRRW